MVFATAVAYKPRGELQGCGKLVEQGGVRGGRHGRDPPSEGVTKLGEGQPAHRFPINRPLQRVEERAL